MRQEKNAELYLTQNLDLLRSAAKDGFKIAIFVTEGNKSTLKKSFFFIQIFFLVLIKRKS